MTNSDRLEEEYLTTSFLWGQSAGAGIPFTSHSPLNGQLLGTSRQLDDNELRLLLALPLEPNSLSFDEVYAFSLRLHTALQEQSDAIFEALQLETGFIGSDCREVRDAILHFARDFGQSGGALHREPSPRHYEANGQSRIVRQVAVPWGTISVILPSSAALFLGITCLLNALAAGNRVILRFPASCPLSASILCEALANAQTPGGFVSVVMVPAKQLVAAIHQSSTPLLVHYLGSSGHASKIVSQGFTSRTPVIADGEGNTWVWVSDSADVASTAQILVEGSLRYNGQTCTSINGALIHPAIYDQLRAALLLRWTGLRGGDPRDESTNVGPLSSEEQAQWCLERVNESGGGVIGGGRCEGSLLQPTLVEDPQLDSDLVTQGLFGPALWITRATAEEFAHRWPQNQYPLCAGLFGCQGQGTLWAARLSNAARIVIDADPSIEWVFEPWGGYPSSGNNPVSSWADKYRRIVALDQPDTSPLI